MAFLASTSPILPGRSPLHVRFSSSREGVSSTSGNLASSKSFSPVHRKRSRRPGRGPAAIEDPSAEPRIGLVDQVCNRATGYQPQEQHQPADSKRNKRLMCRTRAVSNSSFNFSFTLQRMFRHEIFRAMVAVVLIGSTTEDDIRSAMRGLTLDENSQMRSALVAPDNAVPSASSQVGQQHGDGGRLSGGPEYDATVGGVRADVGRTGFEESQEGMRETAIPEHGLGTDLMQTLQGGGVRQAGPLTHGF